MSTSSFVETSIFVRRMLGGREERLRAESAIRRSEARTSTCVREEYKRVVLKALVRAYNHLFEHWDSPEARADLLRATDNWSEMQTREGVVVRGVLARLLENPGRSVADDLATLKRWIELLLERIVAMLTKLCR